MHVFNFVTAFLYFMFFIGWGLFFQSNGACARNSFSSRLGGEGEVESRSNIMLLMMLFTLLGFMPLNIMARD